MHDMYKAIIFTLLLTIINFIVKAQKLPNVQKEGVWAGNKVLVDGNAKDRDVPFQAYNHATEISYTLANDDSNLYLIIKATTREVITRILRGGLTFVLDLKEKKNAEGSIAITYPVADMPLTFRSIVYKYGKIDTSEYTPGTLKEKNNELIMQHARSIRVRGIAGVDSVISIYNEDGIKAAGSFDLKQSYTQELCLPLKYLHKLIGLAGNLSTIHYHIILNSYTRQPTFGAPTNMDGSPANDAFAERLKAAVARIDAAWAARTDFFGEYTLAKKP